MNTEDLTQTDLATKRSLLNTVEKSGEITLMSKQARILTNDLFYLIVAMRIQNENWDFDRLICWGD